MPRDRGRVFAIAGCVPFVGVTIASTRSGSRLTRKAMSGSPSRSPATASSGGTEAFTSAYNVISVSFDPDNNAYAALTALKELDSQNRLELEAAAVVESGEDGELVVKDRVGSDQFGGRRAAGRSGCSSGSSAARSGS